MYVSEMIIIVHWRLSSLQCFLRISRESIVTVIRSWYRGHAAQVWDFASRFPGTGAAGSRTNVLKRAQVTQMHVPGSKQDDVVYLSKPEVCDRLRHGRKAKQGHGSRGAADEVRDKAEA